MHAKLNLRNKARIRFISILESQLCMSLYSDNFISIRVITTFYCTCIVHECQLRIYGHVARYPEVDPVHQIVLIQDNLVWRRPRGCLQLSWLEQVDESCQKLLRMGRGPAWRLARRNPRVWRRRVGDTTCPPAYKVNWVHSQ